MPGINQAKGQLVWKRTRIVLLLGDILAVLIALRLAYVSRFVLDVLPQHVPAIDPVVFPLSILLLISFYIGSGLYDQRYVGAGYSEYTRVAATTTYGLAVLVLVSYLEAHLAISRGFLFILRLAAIAAVTIERFLFRLYLRQMARRGHKLRRVLVVGASRQGLELARQLAFDRGASSEVCGLL